jgi:hypothetical protein
MRKPKILVPKGEEISTVWYEAWLDPAKGYRTKSCITAPNGVSAWGPHEDFATDLLKYENVHNKVEWQERQPVLVPWRFDTRKQAEAAIKARIEATKSEAWNYDETGRWHVVEVRQSKRIL